MKTELRKQNINIFFLLLSALLFSCTSSKTDSGELRSIPIKELKERINTNSKTIETFEGSGSISVETPEESNTGAIEIRIKKPDSLLVKIEGPFGIDIATALITGKEFIYYNVQENKVITGPTNEANMGAILKIKMGFDELLNSLIASFVFKDENNDSLDAPAENNNYLIMQNTGAGSFQYLIEPNSLLVDRYSVFDTSNKKVLEVTYSKYSNINSVYLPEKLIIKQPDKRQTIWIDYNTKNINGKELSFKIRIPKSAKVIKWN